MKKLLHLRLLSVIVLMLAAVGVGYAEKVTLFHETFGNNENSARDWDDSYSVKSGVEAVYSNVTYDVTNVKQSKNNVGSTLSGLAQSSTSSDAVFIAGPLDLSNCSDVTLSYKWKAGSTKSSATYYTKIYYATSSTGTYTELTHNATAQASSFSDVSVSLPAAALVSTTYIKVVFKTSNTQAVIDELDLNGNYNGTTTPPTPGKTTPTLSFDPAEYTVAANRAFTAPTLTNPQNVAVTYSSSTTTVATVDATSGAVDVKGVGETTITASFEGDDTYNPASAQYRLTVTPPLCNVTWDVNGETTTTTVAQGAALTLPTAPTSTGYEFVGWATTYTVAANGEGIVWAPATVPATDNVTYYAVFAQKETGIGDVPVTITNEEIVGYASGHGSYSTNYELNGFTGKWMINNNSGTYTLQLGYNTNTSKSANNSHLTTPRCNGPITKVTATLSQSSNVTLFLTDSDDLGCAQENNATYGSGSVSNTQVEINVTGTPTQFHIYPSATANIETITIYYTGTTTILNNYTTAPAALYAVTLASDGISSFSANKALDFTNIDGVTAYVASSVGESTVVLTEVNAIPANTGLVLIGTEGASFNVPVLAENPTLTENNMLEAVAAGAEIPFSDANNNIYVLGKHNGEKAFHRLIEAPMTSQGNYAYLVVPVNQTQGTAPARRTIAFTEDDVNGIEDVAVDAQETINDGVIYNINGQRVNESYKGFVIKNGKKFINK